MALLTKAVFLIFLAAPAASARRLQDQKKFSLKEHTSDSLISLDKERGPSQVFDKLVKRFRNERGQFTTAPKDEDKMVDASDSATQTKPPPEKRKRQKDETEENKEESWEEKKQKMGKLEQEPAKLLRKVCHIEAVQGSSPKLERLAVCTLTFATPPSMSNAEPMDLLDVVKVVVPGYSPKSYSMSAERPGEFDIRFEAQPKHRSSGPVTSAYLEKLNQPAEVVARLTLARLNRSPGSHVGLIAFGTGITEALPIAAAELAKPDAQHVRLLWASETYGDRFWHEEIAALQAEHPERFSSETIASKEHGTVIQSLHGQVTPELLFGVFDWAWGTATSGPNKEQRDGVRFVIIGTKAMVRGAESMLQQLGYLLPGLHSLLL